MYLLKYIFNAYLAFIYFIFKANKQNIWLIGGHNAKLYTDNAKTFYEYILSKHSEIDIYWIVDRNAQIHKDIQGKFLIKGSIKSYIYFYNAKVVLFSDTLNSDIAPLTFVLPLIKSLYHKTFKVYLSHGTIAFKKMPQYKGLRGKFKASVFHSYNLAIASTPLSQKAMEGYNIKPSSIVLAGSARHDTLSSLISIQKVILITPTWRSWLSNHPNFQKSDFFIHYHALLSNHNLHQYLKHYNIIIHFYLHHMLHPYFHFFKILENESIKILSPHADISTEIKSAQLMITDYSSICSDFYYLKKPILFFQFDRKEYIQTIGSEIDLEKSIFGEVFYNSYTLIQYLMNPKYNLKTISTKQLEGEKYFLHFKDKDNCHRIYKSIIKKISQSKHS